MPNGQEIRFRRGDHATKDLVVRSPGFDALTRRHY